MKIAVMPDASAHRTEEANLTPPAPPAGSVLPPSVEHATVADAMGPGIFSVLPSASPTKVARMMALHHVHCVFVMHPALDDPGEPYVWGLVSDLDLMRAVARGPDGDTAGSLAHQPIVTVKPTMPLTEAAAQMVEHRVSHLVVVEPSTRSPMGVLSTADVAEIFAWGESS